MLTEASGLRSQVRVLMVEDEPYMREVFAEFLRARGYEVTEAEDGLDALLKFRHVRPHAVVLDILMPRLGGLRALQRIRAFDQTVTVVVVTGVMDAELRRQVLTAGATEILLKPINLDDLWRALGGLAGPPVRSAPSPRHRLHSPPDNGVPGRVLVVDDDPDLRVTLEQFVALQGFHARSAEDGATALEAIKRDPFDVVLLDIHMPGLSGVEALKRIQEIAPSVKVIMISGEASFELARETLAYGAFDFAAKPLEFTRLVQSLQAALRIKRLEAE